MRFSILIATLLLYLPLFSQHQWEVQAGKGFLIPHRPVMQALQKGPTYIFSLSRMQSAGKDSWKGQEKAVKGLRISHQSFQNATSLGSASALNYLLRVPLGLGFNLTLGGGLAFLTEDYSPSNTENIAIGSSLNASILFELSQSIHFKNSELQLGLAFNHYSNASFSAPNLGLNVPSLFAIIIPKKLAVEASSKAGDYSRQSCFHITWAIGSKENSIADPQRYYASELTLTRSSASKGISQLDLFTTLGYNGGISASIENGIDIINKEFPSSSAGDNLQFGLGLGYRVNFGATQLYLHQGYYLRSQQPEVGNLFHRLGLNHWLDTHWGLGVLLKTHFAKADYLGLSVTYKLGGYEK